MSKKRNMQKENLGTDALRPGVHTQVCYELAEYFPRDYRYFFSNSSIVRSSLCPWKSS
jgi:hypothetical protein